MMTTPRIITVDLDGYLCNETCWHPHECEEATLNQDVAMRTNQDFLQNFIVIYTARRDHLIPATLRWLRLNGVNFHAISNNKIPADEYRDDKNERGI